MYSKTSFMKNISDEISKQMNHLSDIELSKIEHGTHELALKIVKKRSQPISFQVLSLEHKKEILNYLQQCVSREEGLAYITNSLNNKTELEEFANYLDVPIVKQDKIEKIKDKIIESTVGAILRSNAIQGKKYNHK